MSRTILCADLFCGAGGTTTGAKRAIKKRGHRMEVVAVNHWDLAVATHSKNHPEARHYCINLDTADPEELVREGYLDLLMASPECKDHSRARGGKPIKDQRRADAWLINRWLTKLDVRALLVENVPEFVDWGPVCKLPKGHAGPHREGGGEVGADPCNTKLREKKGLYFQKWVESLWGLGYAAEWRVLNCADYGDATTRKRFFLVARKDGQPIRWPAATHSRTGSADMFGSMRRWRSAREIIDWRHPGKSILDRKKPLSVKTRLRIARGLQKYAGALAPYYINLLDLPPEDAARFGVPEAGAHLEPFVIAQNDSTDAAGVRTPSKPRAIGDPLFTVTADAGMALVETGAERFTLANRNNATAKGLDEPIGTATSAPGGGLFAVTPDAAPFQLEGAQTHQAGPGVRSVDEPLTTVDASARKGVVEPRALLLGQHGGGEARTDGEPLHTIAADGAAAVVRPIIDRQYGRSAPSSVDEPLSTIHGAAGHHALVNPHIATYNGNGQARSVEEPLPAQTAKDRHALVDPLTVPYGPTAEARSAEEPLHTIPTKDRLALAAPIIVQTDQTGGNGDYVGAVDQPLSTLTGKSVRGVAEPTAEAFVLGRSSTPTSRPTDEPLPTATGSGAGYLVGPGAEPLLLSRNGHNDPSGRSRSIDQPLPAVTASDAGTPYVVTPAFITPKFGEREGQLPRVHGVDQPLPAVTGDGAGQLVVAPVLEAAARDGIDARRLVVIDGQVFKLDILFRMLFNRELAAAHSFGPYEFVGSQGDVTTQIGNSVPCETAEALVTSILLAHRALAEAAS